MVGKTNLTFISKGDSSNVQLIQKSYVTDATGEIYKMEVINNRFFAFVNQNSDNYNVLMGADAGNMSFLKKGNEFLKVTHIIYTEGNYYLVKYTDACTELYKTADFEEYELINLPEVQDKWLGIFLDSRGKVILATYLRESGSLSANITIYVCESLQDISGAQVAKASNVIFRDSAGEYDNYSTCLINNRIFFKNGRQISLSGGTVRPDNTGQWDRSKYAGGYFFLTSYVLHEGNYLYRSRDMKNVTSYPYKPVNGAISVFPINGNYCFLYNSSSNKYVLNITQDILKVGHPDNEEIEIGESIATCSLLEDDGKTYVGTSNGVIYEFQLDYEGTIQYPDVAIIKTLAAKQALAQSLQYTDDCIAKLKGYIDSKIEENSSVVENNSTKVES